MSTRGTAHESKSKDKAEYEEGGSVTVLVVRSYRLVLVKSQKECGEG
jgi:hypothetical protein